MNPFTERELDYLRGQRLGRLATTGPGGQPQVRPVGFVVDAETGHIDIPGMHNPDTQKWRNVARDGRAAFVVDDVAPPWSPRVIEVRGPAEVLPDVLHNGAFAGVAPGVIRIHPRRILVFGVEEDGPGNRTVAGA